MSFTTNSYKRSQYHKYLVYNDEVMHELKGAEAKLKTSFLHYVLPFLMGYLESLDEVKGIVVHSSTPFFPNQMVRLGDVLGKDTERYTMHILLEKIPNRDANYVSFLGIEGVVMKLEGGIAPLTPFRPQDIGYLSETILQYLLSHVKQENNEQGVTAPRAEGS